MMVDTFHALEQNGEEDGKVGNEDAQVLTSFPKLQEVVLKFYQPLKIT